VVWSAVSVKGNEARGVAPLLAKSIETFPYSNPFHFRNIKLYRSLSSGICTA
jgi:hypothetical protein